MQIARLSPFLSVAPQISEADVGLLAAQGFKAIINNRPDGEAADQPSGAAIQAAAERHGLVYRSIPVISGQLGDAEIDAFQQAMGELKGPVLAYCRSGTRSSTLWALSEAYHLDADAILRATAHAGYNLENLRPRLELRARTASLMGDAAAAADIVPFARANAHDVVIVGGGAAGISTAASLLKRRPDLDVVIVEPREVHYYQPGWTLVGGGVFDRAATEKPMAECMPKGVRWVRAAVAGFEPAKNQVVLEDGERIGYRILVTAPGLELNWDGVEGLRDTLGKNGVTSNYLFEMAPYTWELVQNLKEGTALFTQPPMPIKCAGAPQKAMYLACDHWQRNGALKAIDVAFHTSTPGLFGVAAYVPALMEYIKKYGVTLNFTSTLKAVDGSAKKAWFENKDSDGQTTTVERSFDMIHVTPPQRAPKFIRDSVLADAAGWVDVSPETLRHSRYGNVYALGDAGNSPNAKTAAAVRKQAPVVAENVLAVLDGKGPRAVYDGYGSCPLTVERGKIILAEFGYGGKLLPTFSFLDGTKPSRMAWFLKEKMLPALYFDAMLKGREWLAGPKLLPHEPGEHEATDACGAFERPAANQSKSA